MSEPERNAPGEVLLYDAKCGFCSWWVGFVLRHETDRSLCFAPLSGALARRVIENAPSLKHVDSVVWAELDFEGRPVKTEARSSAVIEVARYLGGWWNLVRALRVIPRPIRDAAYDLVARNRRRLMDPEKCLVIPPESRDRFLDDEDRRP